MIGIKVNLLKDSFETISELTELVGKSCSIELFTEPRKLKEQAKLIEKIDHPLIEKIVLHTATEEIHFSDPLMNRYGLDNCIKQLKMVPEGGGIVFHPFGRGLSPEKRWKSLEEDVRITAELAEIGLERGVELFKENVPPGYEFPHGKSAEDMERLIEHPNLSLCLDLSHQGLIENYNGLKIEKSQYFREEYKRYLPHFCVESFLSLNPRYFHISDHKGWRGEGLEIGDGERDWKILKNLDGILVLEIKNQHEDDFRIWKRNLEKLKSLL